MRMRKTVKDITGRKNCSIPKLKREMRMRKLLNGSCVEKRKLLGLYLISPSEASWEIEESENYSGELLIKPT